MPNDSTAVDFGINLLEEEIDDVIFRTNEFLTDATFTGGQGPFWWILQMSMALAGLFAIKTVRKGYMPNSELQKQYLAIFDEVTASNDKLILRVRFLATKQRADRIVTAMSRFQHRVKENATAAYNRWRDNGLKAKTTTKDNNIITP